MRAAVQQRHNFLSIRAVAVIEQLREANTHAEAPHTCCSPTGPLAAAALATGLS